MIKDFKTTEVLRDVVLYSSSVWPLKRLMGAGHFRWITATEFSCYSPGYPTCCVSKLVAPEMSSRILLIPFLKCLWPKEIKINCLYLAGASVDIYGTTRGLCEFSSYLPPVGDLRHEVNLSPFRGLSVTAMMTFCRQALH